MDSQIKKIPASPDDALDVAIMLNQMKRSLYQAIDSRDWKSTERDCLVSVSKSIERAVYEMNNFYFGSYDDTK